MSARPPISGHQTRRLAGSVSANSCREQMQQLPPLFDHLVGAQQHRLREFESE
jgi:hypothetical protein